MESYKQGKVEAVKKKNQWFIDVASLPGNKVKAEKESIPAEIKQDKTHSGGDKQLIKEIEKLRLRIEKIEAEEESSQQEKARLRDEVLSIHKENTKLHEQNGRLMEEINNLHKKESSRKEKAQGVIAPLTMVIEKLLGLD